MRRSVVREPVQESHWKGEGMVELLSEEERVVMEELGRRRSEARRKG